MKRNKQKIKDSTMLGGIVNLVGLGLLLNATKLYWVALGYLLVLISFVILMED